MQINQYPNQATSLTVEDRFDTDKNLGLGVWQSQQFDLPTLVDGITTAFPSLFDTIYTSDGSLPTGVTRTFNLDTGSLKLTNGKFYVNTTGFTGGLFQMELVSSGSGLIISSASTGIQLSAGSGTGLSISGSGTGFFSSAPRNVIQTSGSIPASVPSSVLDVNSTTQGSRPYPRVTETERDAISSPADYLGALNTTRGKKEIYHPAFGWIGEDLSLCMSSAVTSLITTGTYYFSMAGSLAMRATIAGLAVRPTKKGKITKASFTRFISSTLGNRSYSLYVRINDTTDYLVATQGTTATETFFENSALNANGIPVDVTDSIVMKLVVSGGTTDSANVLFFGHLVIN